MNASDSDWRDEQDLIDELEAADYERRDRAARAKYASPEHQKRLEEAMKQSIENLEKQKLERLPRPDIPNGELKEVFIKYEKPAERPSCD